MGVAMTRNVASPPSVKCRICGRSAGGSAKLCNECAAAVKRARHVSTVSSQFLPTTTSTVSAAAGARAPARRARTRSGALSWLPQRPAAWGVLAAFVIFGAMVFVTGYFAVQEIDTEMGHVRGLLALNGPPIAEAPVARANEPTATTPVALPPGEGEGDDLSRPEIADTPSPRPVPKPYVRKALDNRLARATNVPTDFRVSQSGDGESVPRSAEGESSAPQTSGAPTILAEAPVTDRWQAMNTALAQCSREGGFLAGVVCGERARLQYCDGYWGQVPQCRGANRPENSR